MVLDAVKPLLDEFDALANSFWDPEHGADFAKWLATGADDLYAGRITVVLLGGGAEELASFLRADDAVGLAKQVVAGAPTILLAAEGADISRELRLATAGDASPWKPNTREAHRVQVNEDVPLQMERVRLIVMADTQFNDASPSLAALLRHHVDVVVVARRADTETLASVAATLGDLPALVFTVAGSTAIDSHEMARRRCVGLEVDADKGIGAAVQSALSGVLPLLVEHRCKRWLGEWRRELQVEAERLGDVLKVRESELARRTSLARPGERYAEEILRSAQAFATDALTQLEKQLQANALQLSGEQLVGTLRDADLDWGEATIDGRRPLDPAQRKGRWSQREIYVGVDSECLDRIEKRLAQAALRHLEDDQGRILRVVQSIETDVEDRVCRIHGRNSLPAHLRLPVCRLQSSSVVDGISVSGGSDEKLVLLGAYDIFRQAYSGVNGIAATLMGLVALGGSALMWEQPRQMKQLPAVSVMVIAVLLGMFVVQWRRAPRLEATVKEEKTQALSTRLIASTGAAIRAYISRRDKLHDQYIKAVSDELSKYFRSLESALRQRATQAASEEQDSARAASTGIARRVALMQGAAMRAERCIDTLADPAGAAYRQLIGDRTNRPPASRPQRTVAQQTAALPSNPPVPPVPPVKSVKLRPDTARASFPGRDVLVKLLGARGQD